MKKNLIKFQFSNNKSINSISRFMLSGIFLISFFILLIFWFIFEILILGMVENLDIKSSITLSISVSSGKVADERIIFGITLILQLI